jgi:hypothetical protein
MVGSLAARCSTVAVLVLARARVGKDPATPAFTNTYACCVHAKLSPHISHGLLLLDHLASSS